MRIYPYIFFFLVTVTFFTQQSLANEKTLNPFEQSHYWSGSYNCGRTTNPLVLIISSENDSQINATFYFEYKGKSGFFSLSGTYNDVTRKILLKPKTRQLTKSPARGWHTISMEGNLSQDNSTLSGTVSCRGNFHVNSVNRSSVEVSRAITELNIDLLAYKKELLKKWDSLVALNPDYIEKGKNDARSLENCITSQSQNLGLDRNKMDACYSKHEDNLHSFYALNQALSYAEERISRWNKLKSEDSEIIALLNKYPITPTLEGCIRESMETKGDLLRRSDVDTCRTAFNRQLAINKENVAQDQAKLQKLEVSHNLLLFDKIKVSERITRENFTKKLEDIGIKLTTKGEKPVGSNNDPNGEVFMVDWYDTSTFFEDASKGQALFLKSLTDSGSIEWVFFRFYFFLNYPEEKSERTQFYNLIVSKYGKEHGLISGGGGGGGKFWNFDSKRTQIAFEYSYKYKDFQKKLHSVSVSYLNQETDEKYQQDKQEIAKIELSLIKEKKKEQKRKIMLAEKEELILFNSLKIAAETKQKKVRKIVENAGGKLLESREDINNKVVDVYDTSGIIPILPKAEVTYYQTDKQILFESFTYKGVMNESNIDVLTKFLEDIQVKYGDPSIEPEEDDVFGGGKAVIWKRDSGASRIEMRFVRRGQEASLNLSYINMTVAAETNESKKTATKIKSSAF